MRKIGLLCLALFACLALLIAPAAAATSFPQTGFSITNDKIQDYFDHRGGVRVFGYPISREFYFLGTRVQFFQRAVLQVGANGNVGLLNLLSDDLLPYARINGSTFPSADSSLLGAALPASDPDFAARALVFVKLYAPDNWEGMQTNFYSTFANTVSYQEAFPNGGADQGLMPLINLEIWGLPTSRPAYDPNNGNFVYLRFQRGIMHFDKTTGLTQGILLGDYLKSILTGQNLPGDLAQQAQNSKLYRQYNNALLGGVARPGDLPGTNLFAAFEQDGVVVPTPVPATPTPVATATPVPPVATPTPQAPATIEVTGEPKFIEQVNATLNLLATKSPYNYGILKQNVYRIDQDPTGPYAAPSTNPAGHSMKIPEWIAWAPDWNNFPDNQREWFAGLLIHNAVHMAQVARGVSPDTRDAELEALLRQQDALSAVETTTDPTHQYWDYVQTAVDRNTGWFGHWQQPQTPGWVRPTPTPTP